MASYKDLYPEIDPPKNTPFYVNKLGREEFRKLRENLSEGDYLLFQEWWNEEDGILFFLWQDPEGRKKEMFVLRDENFFVDPEPRRNGERV